MNLHNSWLGRRMRLPWPRRLSPTAWQMGLLFGVDMITNVADYAFHIYLGWALRPGDFAVVQTMNAVFMVVMTAFGVMQPVVARFTVEAAAHSTMPAGRWMDAGRAWAVFQLYFRQSLALGGGLGLLAWWGRGALATWLNVPVSVVVLGAFMLALALTRPVVAGMLQGQQRFVAFGAVRTSYALSRLALAPLLIGLLMPGAAGGVAAMLWGSLLALAVGLILLGGAVWRRGPRLPAELIWAGWRLSLAALLGYLAYMGLLNLDLIWVNRVFAAEDAGSYATAVVLRRVLSVLPGAVLVILYPRLVAALAQRRLPDRLLLKAAAVVLVANLVVTIVYFAFGPVIVRLMFGVNYAMAAPLLGWMGVAVLGYSLASIWLNLFLAARPWPFVGLLALLLGAQWWLLSLYRQSLLQVTFVFVATGWLAALGGLGLYLGWLRPWLARRPGIMIDSLAVR